MLQPITIAKKSLLHAIKDISPRTSLDAFSKLSGINLMTLYKINNGKHRNLRVSTMEAIYDASLRNFGKGIKHEAYLETIF
jgi:predicted transcriptional regulator